jgi:molybdopterin molybdotransferase
VTEPPLSVAEAHARLMRLFAPLEAEEVPLAQAAGRVLARDVVAARPQPPFDASAMDGYAIQSADAAAGARLHVIGISVAGARFPGPVGPGQAVRIFTGAPMPDGADLVVIQEDADRDGDVVTLRAGRDAASHVRLAGGDFPAGMRLRAPRRIGPSDAALMAAMNAGRVAVTRRPVVALVPTGDELVMPGEEPGRDQIVASNGFGLKAMLEAGGAEARMLPIARDTPESLTAVLGLAEGADLIVTLGGASVGDVDLVQSTARAQGLELDFYRIAMRPGKPLMAGRLRGVPLVGLPGNPVSAMVCGHLFLRPAIDAMLGLPAGMPATTPARLGCDLGRNGPRAHYMRARVEPGPLGWRCTPFPRQDSSLLSVLTEANALMVRPPHDTPRTLDDPVEFLWLD